MASQVLPAVAFTLRSSQSDDQAERNRRKFSFLIHGYKRRFWWFFAWEFLSEFAIGVQAMFVDASVAFHFIAVYAMFGACVSFFHLISC